MLGYCFSCGVRFLHDDNGPTLCERCTPPGTWGPDGCPWYFEYIDRGDDVQSPFRVLVDTREQKAYKFCELFEVRKHKTLPLYVPVTRCTIPAGDYSIDGYADKVAVERKSLADFLGSFGGNREAEERKLVKLAKMEVAWYVLEFSYADLLLKHVPHSQVSRKAMSRSVMSYQVKYPSVHWWFAGERWAAESVTYRLLEKWFFDRVGRPAKEAAAKEQAKARG